MGLTKWLKSCTQNHCYSHRDTRKNKREPPTLPHLDWHRLKSKLNGNNNKNCNNKHTSTQNEYRHTKNWTAETEQSWYCVREFLSFCLVHFECNYFFFLFVLGRSLYYFPFYVASLCVSPFSFGCLSETRLCPCFDGGGMLACSYVGLDLCFLMVLSLLVASLLLLLPHCCSAIKWYQNIHNIFFIRFHSKTWKVRERDWLTDWLTFPGNQKVVINVRGIKLLVFSVYLFSLECIFCFIFSCFCGNKRSKSVRFHSLMFLVSQLVRQKNNKRGEETEEIYWEILVWILVVQP